MNGKIIFILAFVQIIQTCYGFALGDLCAPNQPNCPPQPPQPAPCLPHQPNCGPQFPCKPGFTGARCETEYFRCSTNGRFKDPYGCAIGKYFECAFVRDSQRVDQTGVLTQRECPLGLRFNPACDSCDYAANVIC